MVTVSADHILAASAAGAFEPQRQNNFTVEIDILGEEVSLALQGINFPNITTQVLEVHYQNEKRNWAGKTDYGEFTMEVFDAIDREVAKKIDAWYRFVHDPKTGCIDLAKNYKKEGTLLLNDGCGNTTREWKLVGLMPKSVNYGQGQMENADKVIIQLGMACDKVFMVVA